MEEHKQRKGYYTHDEGAEGTDAIHRTGGEREDDGREGEELAAANNSDEEKGDEQGEDNGDVDEKVRKERVAQSLTIYRAQMEAERRQEQASLVVVIVLDVSAVFYCTTRTKVNEGRFCSSRTLGL